MQTFSVGDKVWFDLYQDDYWWRPRIISGDVIQVCEIHGNQLLIAVNKSGHEKYHMRQSKDVFSSLSEMRKYAKTLAPVEVGDLVTFVLEFWQTGGHAQELCFGTCIKITKNYAHIQTETGMKRVRKYCCFVTSRPHKETDAEVPNECAACVDIKTPVCKECGRCSCCKSINRHKLDCNFGRVSI